MQSNPNTTTKMNNWERVKFLDVCDIQGGTQPPKKEWSSEKKDGYIRMLQIRDFTQDKEKYIEYVKDKSTLKKCRKDDILIGRYGASVGKILIGLEGAYNVAIVKTIPDENILDKNYLYYFLIAPTFQGYIKNAGTRAAQSGFNKSDLENLFLPLPPLSMQKEIVERLDKADALRQKDQELVAQYDHLAQALFIDLFGDPVTNEKGWERKKLGEVCSKITDGTHDTPERLKEGVKFITGKHIKPFYIDYENSDYVTEEIHNQIYKRCNPEYEDVLYTNIGVNYATAAMNIVDYEFSMKNVALLKNNRNIFRGRFLESLLNFEDYKVKLKNRLGVGGAQQFLSLKQIKDIEILLPPISLQNQFAEIIENIEAQKAKAKKQAEESENLFQSLLQEAFSV